jgi:hypothetical protein
VSPWERKVGSKWEGFESQGEGRIAGVNVTPQAPVGRDHREYTAKDKLIPRSAQSQETGPGSAGSRGGCAKRCEKSSWSFKLSLDPLRPFPSTTLSLAKAIATIYHDAPPVLPPIHSGRTTRFSLSI